MKTFLLIALILLAVNVYAEEGKSLSIIYTYYTLNFCIFSDTLKAVDDNPNTDDKDTGIYSYYAS